MSSGKTGKTSAPKIGDKGPAGGIVFSIEGKKAYECSEIIGQKDWENAKTLCKNYRGGGKSDWFLPNEEQLNYIYNNLRKPGIISDNKWYWSSTPNTDFSGSAFAQDFSDGRQNGMNPTYGELSVRAVRIFEF